MDRKHMKRDAFSLIELVITIAIMVIFVGVVSLSVALLRSTDTKGLANGINDSLTDLKSMTEAHRGPYYLYIYKADDSFYATYSESNTFAKPDEPTGTKLGSASLIVKVKDYSGDVKEISGDVYVPVQILKKDGSYKTCPSQFDVYNDTKLEYSVILTKDTGLHYIEQL